jgi:hypothetical protein
MPGSGGPPTGSLRSNATSNARSCGGGRPASEFRSIPSRRSTSVPNDSRVSATLARPMRTRSPRVRAASMPASHSVVLPIPGPPLMTSPRAWPLPATNSCRDASSGSRPTGVACPALTATNVCPPPRGRWHSSRGGTTAPASIASAGSACRTFPAAGALRRTPRTRPRRRTRRESRRPGSASASRLRIAGRRRGARPHTPRSTAARSRSRGRRRPSPRAPFAAPPGASRPPCPRAQRSSGRSARGCRGIFGTR